MIERSADFSVPQIFINGEGIIVSDDLASLNASGALDQLLGFVSDSASDKAQIERAQEPV